MFRVCVQVIIHSVSVCFTPTTLSHSLLTVFHTISHTSLRGLERSWDHGPQDQTLTRSSYLIPYTRPLITCNAAMLLLLGQRTQNAWLRIGAKLPREAYPVQWSRAILMGSGRTSMKPPVQWSHHSPCPVPHTHFVVSLSRFISSLSVPYSLSVPGEIYFIHFVWNFFGINFKIYR